MKAPARLPRWAEFGLLPLINLCAALLISGAIIRLIGESPWAAFKLMVAGAFGAQDSIGYTLFYATDFVFTGLAVAVAFHAGLFNIGGEGQAYIGGLGAGLVCLACGSWSPWIVVPLGIGAAAVFGAAWAFIPAWLQAKRGSHIVITTIMSNFIASALMTYLLVNVLIKPGQQSPETREFGPGAVMPAVDVVLAKFGIPFAPSPFNLASLLALVACFLVWVFIWRTRWGYALRVVGQNPQAACDGPRFRWVQGMQVSCEDGFPESTLNELRQRGHDLLAVDDYNSFGSCQAIWRLENGYLGASDPRRDGQAAAF